MTEYRFDEKKHIHLLNGKPLIGTSTAMKIVAKPLTWWASGMAVSKFGWLDPKKNKEEAVQEALIVGFEKVKGLDMAGYGNLLDEAYRAHSVRLKDSATKGTDRHELLEAFVKNTMVCQQTGTIDETKYSEEIEPFIEWSKKNVKRFLFSELHCYSERLWVGGISDAGAELKDGKVVVIDFKSSKEAYADQFWQCGGYGIQIAENGGYTPQGEKIFTLEKSFDAYLIVPFGAKDITPVPVYDVAGCNEAAELAINLYKKSQNFLK